MVAKSGHLMFIVNFFFEKHCDGSASHFYKLCSGRNQCNLYYIVQHPICLSKICVIWIFVLNYFGSTKGSILNLSVSQSNTQKRFPMTKQFTKPSLKTKIFFKEFIQINRNNERCIRYI